MTVDALARAKGLREQAERLLKEARALEARDVTYDEWWDWAQTEDYSGLVATVPARVYDNRYERRSIVNFSPDGWRFIDGERPVLMRGSRMLMANNGYGPIFKDYVERIMQRYVATVDRPTIFRRREWHDYSTDLRRRVLTKIGYGASNWRYPPSAVPTGHPDTSIGLGRGWPRQFAVIRGQVVNTMANAPHGLSSAEYDRMCAERADMILEMAASMDKLAKLEKRLAV